jgi:acyl-homoserine lactone synthase
MLHIIDAGNRRQQRYADMLEQSYRIRHDIFVSWRGWKAIERPDGREIDQFDNEDATYFMWTDGDEVVGGARMIPTSKPNLLADVFPHIVTLGEIPSDPYIWEGTRLFSSRTGNSKANRHGVTRDVFCAMFEFAVVSGLKGVSIICDTFFLPRLLEKGVEVIPLSLPTTYAEGTCIAILVPVSLEQLVAIRAHDRGTVLFDIDTSRVQRPPIYAQREQHAH